MNKYAWLGFGAALLGWTALVSTLASSRSSAFAVDVPSLPDKRKAEPTQAEQAALEEGQALFRGLCSGCHGGAGRGGKGPDLTRKKFMHGSTDEDIVRTIRNGVPKTTMKKLGDVLKDEQVAKLLLFIRSLQRAPADSTWKPYMAGGPKIG